MSDDNGYGDPLTRPYWDGARDGRLLVQRCRACGQHQHYPRPMCLACEAPAPEWVEASGDAVVHSMTTVRIAVRPELVPPYVVALVDLAEGPRLVTNIIGGEVAIGDAVRLAWRERPDAPPLPVFTKF